WSSDVCSSDLSLDHRSSERNDLAEAGRKTSIAKDLADWDARESQGRTLAGSCGTVAFRSRGQDCGRHAAQDSRESWRMYSLQASQHAAQNCFRRRKS